MTSATSLTPSIPALNFFQGGSIQQHINGAIDDLLATFPQPERLSAEQRRGIIARYTAVLEGNFIYWMTGAYLAVKTDVARVIILENLHEEIADCHPGMMRHFALAAHATPSEADAAEVYRDLRNVRLFIGRLSSVQLVLMMAFFEGLIQKFMPYLADLAKLQGSQEMEYTDVHGVCDVEHTAGLFRALDAEAALCPLETATDLFEGVGLLRKLLQTIVRGTETAANAFAD
jgi:CRP-like cAMP-binding protein